MIRTLQENFNTALDIVKSGIPEGKHYTLPILAHVKVETDNGMVNLITTDLETLIQYRCGCKVIDDIAFTVPCKVLSDMVDIFHNDIIDISQGKDKNGSNIAIFKCNNQTVNLYTMDSADYPPTPKTEGTAIEIYDLADAIKNVKDLLTADKNGWGKTDGLLFDIEKGLIVATDCKRMKVAHINTQPVEGLKFRISKKAATMLLKCKDTVKVTYQPPSENRSYSIVQFESGNMAIITQNLESNNKYPDYQKVADEHKDLVTIY